MLRESFNDDWHVADETPGRDSKRKVGPVSVPYDCMLYEPRDPNSLNGYNMGFFPGGVYRYTKTFFAPESWRNGAALLEFEGVYHRSEVFLNGHKVGGRAHGYTLFHVNIAIDHLHYGSDNVLEVVARNNDMPNARWYTGSGIYRPVHLLIGGSDYVKPFGMRVTTHSVLDDTALIEIEVEITRSSSPAYDLKVISEIQPQSSSKVYKPTSCNLISSASTAVIVKQFVSIPNASLWSPESPHLYTARVQLVSCQDDSVVDHTIDTFGIRTLHLDSKNGLQINGRSYKLRGGCIHHDNGVIGAHTLEMAEERRIRILKEYGYNAIRSVHNPISMALLRACDKLGVVVMNELCDQWFKPKIFFDYSIDFVDWWEDDLKSMISSSYNHPSIIMHSIGNEIMETANPVGVEQNQRMAEVIRREDSTRYVTNAINGFMNMICGPEVGAPRTKPRGDEAPEDPGKNMIAILNMLIGTLQIISPYLLRLPVVDRKTQAAYSDLDICGYNYMWGRYEKDVKKYPDRIIVGSETGSKNLVYAWPIIEKHPQLIGDFVWTAWDYVGEAGIGSVRYNSRMRIIYPWPALLSGQCVIDITGHRQTQSYNAEYIWGLRSGVTLAVKPVPHGRDRVVKSTWRLTDTMRSWSWEGYEGQGTWVEVYSDAPKVELRLNGKSVSWWRKNAGAAYGYMAKFWVTYQPGILSAVAYDHDGNEVGRDYLYSAKTDVLCLSAKPEVDSLAANGADIAFVPIHLTDQDGVLRPVRDQSVTVHVDGAATLLGFGSAEASTEESFASTSHRTYYGRALAVIRAGLKSGTARVRISSEGCEDVHLVIPVV